MEAGVFCLQTRNGGQKGFHAQEPHGVLLGFNSFVTLMQQFSDILVSRPLTLLKTTENLKELFKNFLDYIYHIRH